MSEDSVRKDWLPGRLSKGKAKSVTERAGDIHNGTQTTAKDDDGSSDERWDKDVERCLVETHVVDGMCQQCCRVLETCCPLLDQPDNYDPFHSEAYTTAQLNAAARLGCRVCGCMVSTLRHSERLQDVREQELRRETQIALRGAKSTPDKKALFLRAYQTVSYPSLELVMWGPDDRQDVIAEFRVQAVECPAETGAPFDVARHWLQSCLGSHSCSSSYRDLQLPKRLVSIVGSLRVVETSTFSCSTEIKYATLSYCWGDGSDMKLTEQSYAQLLNEIPEKRLPQTFRDAIVTARALGLEWIWIDALCIIQEQPDQRDWRSQAAIMQDVYGGACINLAASTSSDVHAGALPSEQHSVGFDVQPLGRRMHFYPRNAWSQAVTGSVLSRRGWAFQERLLAPRTLYLSKLGLFWECSERRSAEHSPDNFYRYDRWADDLCVGRRRAWKWEELIESYSRSMLSHQTDRLVAISGLAKCQQAMTEGSYLAGMWQQDLVGQLAWSTWYLPWPRTQSWAPTWSWVSVDGQVCFPEARDQMRSMVSVLSASTQLVSSDPFGEVSSGVLRLACKGMLEVRIDIAVRRPTFHNPNAKGHMYSLYHRHGAKIDFLPDCSEDGWLHDGVAYLLPIFRAGKPGTGIGEGEVMHWLVLRSCQAGMFRRIGRSDTRTDYFLEECRGDMWYDRYVEEGERAAASVCHERTQDGQYAVTIV